MDLAAERKNCFLLLQADERSQRFVDHCLLCRQGRQLLRLGNQFVVQDDVRSQATSSMCIVSLIYVYEQSLKR